ncbi:MAG: hypothetical protein M3O55_08035 [Actinomycetota bacterium]|nr:hypothetical protein [Actinomycetota bacterium]
MIVEPVPGGQAEVLVAPAASSGPDSAGQAAGWPCAACGAGNSFDSTLCGSCGSGFLAGLSEEGGPDLRLPMVGSLARFGRSARLGIAVVVGLFVALLLSGVLALFGKVFG